MIMFIGYVNERYLLIERVRRRDNVQNLTAEL
jgi:hypothetical protein